MTASSIVGGELPALRGGAPLALSQSFGVSQLLLAMSKRLLVVLDRSLFHRFGESERRLAPRIANRAKVKL